MIIKPRFFSTPAAEGGFQEQTQSVDFNGTDESMVSSSNTLIGVGDVFSIGIWWKPSIDTTQETLFALRSSDNANNFSRIEFRGDVANDPIGLVLFNPASSPIIDISWDSLVTLNVWHLTILTRAGTVGAAGHNLIHNGVDQGAADTVVTNTADTMTDTTRKIILAAINDSNALPFDGRIHSVGIWNSVLTEAEAAALYNSGDGKAVDWSVNFGDYASSANLQHWYRIAFDLASVSDMGQDFGNASTLINVGDGALNIDPVDDVVSDAPGV